jgi:hypothetical protein
MASPANERSINRFFQLLILKKLIDRFYIIHVLNRYFSKDLNMEAGSISFLDAKNGKRRSWHFKIEIEI